MSTQHRARFLHAFLRRPAETGALLPSSRFLAHRILRHVEWDRARVIVELGPGTGCFTQQILSSMHSRATLLAIESNPQFVEDLRGSFHDPRLCVVHDSARHLRTALRGAGLSDADWIICGLPFANMHARERLVILRACRQVLRPGGTLVLFQYRTLLLPTLNGMFSSVAHSYEWRNFPPAHVFRCTKQPSWSPSTRKQAIVVEEVQPV